MKKRTTLLEELYKSINKSAGIPVNESKGNLRHLFEADDDEDEKDDDDDVEDELEDVEDELDDVEDEIDDLDADEDEIADVEDDIDDVEGELGDVEDEITDDDMKDAEIETDDLDVDFDAKSDDFESDEFETDDLDVDLGGLDGEGVEEMGGMDDTDDLLANEPPDFDRVGEDGLDESSDFTQFVTNQLIDFPVDDVTFAEENGARYVDARFGDKAVTFVLYTGEEGQPLLGMLYDNEAYRIELPSEAVGDDGNVRDNFMPIDWIRDNLARLVDTAPTFECYRLKSKKSNCNESKTKRKRIRKLSESEETCKLCLRAIKQGNAENIETKKLGQPAKAKKNDANDGVKTVKGAKEAELGGGILKWASKAGGDAVMKVKNCGCEADGGIQVPTKSGGKASL